MPWIYWFAVVMVAVFGTMAADVARYGLGVPFLASAAFFLALLAVIFIWWYAREKTLSIHRWFRLNSVLAFWFAYIITRPLGASFSDWLALPTAINGPHWGTGPVTLALTAAIIALVGYLNAVDGKAAKP